jgi:phosphatidylserine decarboxylase
MEAVIPIMPRGKLFLAREGYPFIGLSFVLAVAGWWFFWPVGAVFTLGFFFCLYFFRDPSRDLPAGPELLVSPADGTVLKIEELAAGPHYPTPHRKISIFMSPLDVHVNRIPCDGKVREIHYHPGKFFVASLDKASEHNERNAVVMENSGGQRIVFTQIAGLVARRIVCYLQQGVQVQRGDRYGLIRFGSRMEVCVPLEWRVLVKPGDKVRGVTTALTRMER